MSSDDYLNIWAKSCMAATLLAGLERRLKHIEQLDPEIQALFKTAYRQTAAAAATLALLEDRLNKKEHL